MKVELDNRTYHARFKNISERLVHQGGRTIPVHKRHAPLDQLPTDLLKLLTDFDLRHFEAHDGLRWRRFLGIKPPQAISVITTHCDIVEAASGAVIAWGESYYSQSEVDAGRHPNGDLIKPFVKRAARHKSLRRALGEEIRHRWGQAFTERERAAVWAAFDTMHLPRAAKTT